MVLNIILPLLTLTLLACQGPNGDTSEAGIKAAIAAANRCSGKTDCADVGSECPFGCHILVHQSEAAKISSMIEEFKSRGGQQCIYSCVAIKDIVCENKQCRAIEEF